MAATYPGRPVGSWGMGGGWSARSWRENHGSSTSNGGWGKISGTYSTHGSGMPSASHDSAVRTMASSRSSAGDPSSGERAPW